jgi:hypothetical protein
MKPLTLKPTPTLLALLAASMLAGCSSTPTNTQRGAAGGAAIGALAGAVIGNNRGSGNAASGAAIGAAAGAIAGGALGRKSDQQARSDRTYDGESAAVTDIYLEGPPPMPPAPLAETIPAQPSSNSIWIPGYWSFENGDRYSWVQGRWEVPPRGARAYQPAHWRQQGNGYVYVRGFWM